MGRGRKFCFAVIGLLAASTGCGSSGSANGAGSHPQSSEKTAQGSAVSVVAIGDSDATGIGDASSRGWVGRYGDLVKAKLGTVATVENRAMEGETSDQLRSDIANDPALRQALARADVVL